MGDPDLSFQVLRLQTFVMACTSLCTNPVQNRVKSTVSIFKESATIQSVPEGVYRISHFSSVQSKYEVNLVDLSKWRKRSSQTVWLNL